MSSLHSSHVCGRTGEWKWVKRNKRSCNPLCTWLIEKTGSWESEARMSTSYLAKYIPQLESSSSQLSLWTAAASWVQQRLQHWSREWRVRLVSKDLLPCMLCSKPKIPSRFRFFQRLIFPNLPSKDAGCAAAALACSISKLGCVYLGMFLVPSLDTH